MSIKLNDTQLVLLSAASQRDDHCLVPPAGPKRAQAQRAVAKLLEAGLLKEIRAKAGAPIWRRDDESGQTYALKLTAAGAKAIAVDEATASESMGEQRANHPISVNPKPEPVSDPAGIDRPNSNVASTPTSPRGGTKIAQVIELLQRGDGATLAELVAATGWLPHTTRAALTGLRKRGYAVGIDRADKVRGSVYRIEPTEMGKIAPRRMLKRHRLAKRHQIGPGAPRICEPVGRRDGGAPKSERPWRGIGPASAVGVRARNPRRLGREPFRPKRGSASPPVAKPSGRDRSRPSPGMAAHARARLSDPGRGIRGSRSGRSCGVCASPGTKRFEFGGRSSLCNPRADDARGRRAQVRSSAGPGMEWRSGAGHDPRRRVRLERLRLPQPFAGRQGDHRHELERTPLLRVEGGQDLRLQQKKKRHPKTELIARYWRVANPRRVRPRNARSFAASRNQGVRFGISERIGLATLLRGRANGRSDRLAQGPAF